MNQNNKSFSLTERKVVLIDKCLTNDIVSSLREFQVPLPIPNKFRVIHLFKNKDCALAIHENKSNETKVVLSRPKENKNRPWEREMMFDIFLSLKDNILLNPLFTIGSDEVGKSDYFGPVVVASVAWKGLDNMFYVGEKDSKRISFQECVEFEKIIKEKCLHSFSLIKPNKMNNFFKNSKEKLNLNHLLLYYHIVSNTNVYNQVEEKQQKSMFFGVDDFLNKNPNLERKYFSELSGIPEIKTFLENNVSIK